MPLQISDEDGIRRGGIYRLAVIHQGQRKTLKPTGFSASIPPHSLMLSIQPSIIYHAIPIPFFHHHG
jgi:hypothetical protein